MLAPLAVVKHYQILFSFCGHLVENSQELNYVLRFKGYLCVVNTGLTYIRTDHKAMLTKAMCM